MKAEGWVLWGTDPGLRRLHWLLALVGVLQLAQLLWVLFSSWGLEGTARVRIDKMEVCLEAGAPVEHRRHSLAKLLARPMPSAGDCWRPVELPHVTQTAPGQMSPRSPVARAWYRGHFAVPATWVQGEALQVYAPRASGLAWQVSFDGQPLSDNLDDWRMMWIRPVVATLPAAMVRPGQPVTIDLAVAYVPEAGHALTNVWIGSASLVGADVRWREAIQFTMPQACSIVLLVLGRSSSASG